MPDAQKLHVAGGDLIHLRFAYGIHRSKKTEPSVTVFDVGVWAGSPLSRFFDLKNKLFANGRHLSVSGLVLSCIMRLTWTLKNLPF